MGCDVEFEGGGDGEEEEEEGSKQNIKENNMGHCGKVETWYSTRRDLSLKINPSATRRIIRGIMQPGRIIRDLNMLAGSHFPRVFGI